jgi:hypothetical protein
MRRWPLRLSPGGRGLHEFESFVSPITSEDGYLADLTTICAGLADALESWRWKSKPSAS